MPHVWDPSGASGMSHIACMCHAGISAAGLPCAHPRLTQHGSQLPVGQLPGRQGSCQRLWVQGGRLLPGVVGFLALVEQLHVLLVHHLCAGPGARGQGAGGGGRGQLAWGEARVVRITLAAWGAAAGLGRAVHRLPGACPVSPSSPPPPPPPLSPEIKQHRTHEQDPRWRAAPPGQAACQAQGGGVRAGQQHNRHGPTLANSASLASALSYTLSSMVPLYSRRYT